MELDGINIVWLGHSGFKIEAEGLILYIDPFQTEETEKADLILITHEHHDHCSKEDIEKIMGEKTEIVCNKFCAEKLGMETKEISEGETIEVRGVKITGVPAYNKEKEFHPKGKGLGFLINIKETTIYHAGDTDFIPEMREIEKIDIAFLPVGGTYTMNADEAVEAAELIRPRIAIPMHYGSIVGSKKDAEWFREFYSGRLYILEKGK